MLFRIFSGITKKNWNYFDRFVFLKRIFGAPKFVFVILYIPFIAIGQIPEINDVFIQKGVSPESQKNYNFDIVDSTLNDTIVKYSGNKYRMKSMSFCFLEENFFDMGITFAVGNGFGIGVTPDFRTNIIELNEFMSLSLALPITLGIFPAEGGGSTRTFGASIVSDANIGFLATKANYSAVGGFIGAGYGYWDYGFYEEGRRYDGNQADGFIFRAGIRIYDQDGGIPSQVAIMGSWLVNHQNKAHSVFAVTLGVFLL